MLTATYIEIKNLVM